MHSERPRLVLVSGAPGGGKTTLAQRLAADLRLPLLAKDAIKEVLGDALGAADRTRSRELGFATFRLQNAIAVWILRGGAGVIVESNFQRGLSEPDLRPLLEQADAVLIHCHASPDELLRRYTVRSNRGERHPVHFDADALPDLRAALAAGAFDPLDLAIPTLVVDTTDGYAPAWATIVAFARPAEIAGDGTAIPRQPAG